MANRTGRGGKPPRPLAYRQRTVGITDKHLQTIGELVNRDFMARGKGLTQVVEKAIAREANMAEFLLKFRAQQSATYEEAVDPAEFRDTRFALPGDMLEVLLRHTINVGWLAPMLRNTVDLLRHTDIPAFAELRPTFDTRMNELDKLITRYGDDLAHLDPPLRDIILEVLRMMGAVFEVTQPEASGG